MGLKSLDEAIHDSAPRLRDQLRLICHRKMIRVWDLGFRVKSEWL
jgi:hypothetical protein